MAKVVMFPQKKKLPKCIEEELYRVAKDYVEVLYSAAMLMDLEPNSDKPTQEEFMELMGVAFAEGICEAIEEMDEL